MDLHKASDTCACKTRREARKKGRKNEAVGSAREHEGPKKRTELSEPVHCLHSLLTKFLQLAACTCAALEFNDVSTISVTPSPL